MGKAEAPDVPHASDPERAFASKKGANQVVGHVGLVRSSRVGTHVVREINRVAFGELEHRAKSLQEVAAGHGGWHLSLGHEQRGVAAAAKVLKHRWWERNKSDTGDRPTARHYPA